LRASMLCSDRAIDTRRFGSRHGHIFLRRKHQKPNFTTAAVHFQYIFHVASTYSMAFCDSLAATLAFIELALDIVLTHPSLLIPPCFLVWVLGLFFASCTMALARRLLIS
jgi:hypothetical protein